MAEEHLKKILAVEMKEAQLANVGGETELLAVHAGLPSGLSPADREAGWRTALAELSASVETRGSA